MKCIKNFLLFFSFFIVFNCLCAQSNTGINYKAIIKDDIGNVIANQSIQIEFTIVYGISQSIAYHEMQSTTTDSNGFINVIIGDGELIDDGDFETIGEVQWQFDTHYLNVKIDPGDGFIDFGATQLSAVPYALHAKFADNAFSGNYNDLNNTPTIIDPSGLERITENGSTGWRLVGQNPDFYGEIGDNAIDLSYSNSISSSNGATGQTSLAIGFGATAFGESSISIGRATSASGFGSTAMGYITSSSGFGSIAMGFESVASGNSSIALGEGSIAIGNNSIALGINARAEEVSSTAIGAGTKATGAIATAMGRLTEASGVESLAMGYSTKASGETSTAFGSGAEASGDTSVAMGYFTKALGGSSTAMGYITEASGSAATAMGFETVASGGRSTALGVTTTAPSFAEIVIGSNNLNYTPLSNFSWNDNDRLFVVGNGENSDNKSNALTLLKDGRLYIKRKNSIDPNLILEGVSNTASGDNCIITSDPTYAGSDLFLRSNDAVVIELDHDENEAGQFEVKNGSGIIVFEVNESGNATLSGSLTQNSDVRLKEDIVDLPYGLNEILKMQPKAYHWKNHKQDSKSLGLIAQDVQQIIKEIVNEQDDPSQTLGISYNELIPVLINAIKEQQKIITSQNIKLSEQDTKLAKLTQDHEKFLGRLRRLEQSK